MLEFPGSNCDSDCRQVFSRYLDIKLESVWHQNHELPKGIAGVLIPGGFSYGDYLRAGALASHAPIIEALKKFAKAGGKILGICNGFQVLTEIGLLPGALLPNENGKFLCQQVYLKVDSGSSLYQQSASKPLMMPIAHGEGRYFASQEQLNQLNSEGLVAYRYAHADGRVDEESNPNGSSASIAGVVSPNGRILGMMPHPERAADDLLGSSDGLQVLKPSWLPKKFDLFASPLVEKMTMATSLPEFSNWTKFSLCEDF